MIQSINLEDSLKGNDIKQEKLENLSRLNLFIGQNNSGKSRLIRDLFQNKLVYFSKQKFHKDLIAAAETYNSNLVELQSLAEFHSQLNLVKLQTIQELNLSEKDDGILGYVSERINTLNNVSIENELRNASRIQSNKNDIDWKIRALKKNLENSYNETNIANEELTFERIYFPTLRGLRPLSNSKEDHYKLRTYDDYFSSIAQSDRHEIYTGLSLFSDLTKLLLGSYEERQKVRNFEEFLSQNFFENKEFNIVPRVGEDVVHVLIGKEEYPIHQLGDGIQSIIILTYPLFFNQDKKELVFIEEPEHYLHPGMQRILIKTLLSDRFKNKQFFLTTHSNHLLELVNEYNDVSLYSVQKISEKDGFSVEQILKPDTNLLDLIGVNNASVFLANCTIWVEGITDRLYIKNYLEIYWKEHGKTDNYREDFDYAFVEYSGGNIVHWNFSGDSNTEINAPKISNRIFLIADSDFDKNGDIPQNKKDRFVALNNQLGENFYQLPTKEIENTLKKEIIEKVIIQKEKITSNQLSPKKGNSIDFEKRNIGEWIEGKYDNLRKKYKDQNTLNDKLGFARIAVSKMKNYNDLSTHTIELCEKITAFIQSHKRN